MTDEMDPAEALTLAKSVRERMAARAEAPSWYAPLYGLCCGAIVAGGGTVQPFGVLMTTAGTLFVVLLYTKWQQQSGLSVNGFRKGRTRIIAILLGLALLALTMGGLVLRRSFGFGWGPLACGGAAALIGAFASAAWNRAWLAEIAGKVE